MVYEHVPFNLYGSPEWKHSYPHFTDDETEIRKKWKLSSSFKVAQLLRGDAGKPETEETGECCGVISRRNHAPNTHTFLFVVFLFSNPHRRREAIFSH